MANTKTKFPVALIIRLRRSGKSTREIGREVGTDAGTVSRILKKYAAGDPETGCGGPPPGSREINRVIDRSDVDGSMEVLKLERPATVEELMAACRLDPHVWVPQFFRGNVWQGFYALRGKEGGHRKVNLYQSRLVCKRVISERLEEAILEFIRRFGPKPLPKPNRKKGRKKSATAPKDQMVVWGMWDAHIGSYAWDREVGDNWDVDMACSRVHNSIDEMVDELRPYPIRKILMPIGNDFMHFDSVRMKTAHGEHYLDTDTRYARVYLAALMCLSYMIERALEVCDDVELLYVPGNHDTTSSYTLTVALDQRYRNDSRVSADLSMNPRKYRTWGGCLIGFDHGADAPPDRLAQALSEEARELWGAATYREVQIGDKHRRWEKKYEATVPTGGILIRRNPALCNTDAWHHRLAFSGEQMRSVEAWRYDRFGYRGSHVTWARDEAHPRAKAALKQIT